MNPSNLPHYPKNIFARFKYAFTGICWVFSTQPNFKYQLIIAFLACFLGVYLKISLIDWSLVILVSGLVLSLEIINSSIEAVIDHISPEFSLFAQHAKDAAAGAVLLAAITSVIIGLIIFLPKLMVLF